MEKEETTWKNPSCWTKATSLIVQQIKVSTEAKRICFLLLVWTSMQICRRMIRSLTVVPELLANTKAISNIRMKKWAITMKKWIRVHMVISTNQWKTITKWITSKTSRCNWCNSNKWCYKCAPPSCNTNSNSSSTTTTTTISSSSFRWILTNNSTKECKEYRKTRWITNSILLRRIHRTSSRSTTISLWWILIRVNKMGIRSCNNNNNSRILINKDIMANK